MIDYNRLANDFWRDYTTDWDADWHTETHEEQYGWDFEANKFEDAIEDNHPIRILQELLSQLTASNITDNDLDWMRRIVSFQ